MYMPRKGEILQIYLRDEKEKEEMKKVARELGVSISALIRAFFRSLAEGSKNIIINHADNQVIIGELHVNLQQQNIVQINNNILAYLNLKFEDLLGEINRALRSRSLLVMNNALVFIRDEITKMMRELKSLCSRGNT